MGISIVGATPPGINLTFGKILRSTNLPVTIQSWSTERGAAKLLLSRVGEAEPYLHVAALFLRGWCLDRPASRNFVSTVSLAALVDPNQTDLQIFFIGGEDEDPDFQCNGRIDLRPNHYKPDEAAEILKSLLLPLVNK